MRRLSPFLALALVGCTQTEEDVDGDGYLQVVDCDPNDGAVFPGAPERCNGIDDDCDGEVDESAEDATTWYTDADGDGAGDPLEPITACAAPEGTVDNGLDCDDARADLHPDVAWYPDGDGDGYGEAGGEAQLACVPPAGTAANDSDCDDTDAQVHPGEPERCNGVDDDCSGGIDEGVTATFYADADGDGHGDPADPVEACAAPEDHVEAGDDCDDSDADISPSAPRVCNDGIDNTCDVAQGVDPATAFCDAELEWAHHLLLGSAEDEHAGTALAVARDLFGPGDDGVLVSAPGFTRADGDTTGAAWVVRPSTLAGGATSLDASAIALQGVYANDQASSGLAGVGDVDGDGVPDVVVAAHLYDADRPGLGGRNGGGIFLTSGADLRAAATGDALDLEPGLWLYGDSIADWVGGVVVPAGDVDGDGTADLLVGATGLDEDGDTTAGGLVLLYGGESLSPVGVRDVSDLGRGALLHGPSGESLTVGQAAAGADLDGDGLAEVVAGAWKAESETGAVYLVSGVDAQDGDLGALATATLRGADANGLFGDIVQIIDDQDGDGHPEVLVGAKASSGEGVLQGGGVYLFQPGATLSSVDGHGPADALARVVGETPLIWLGSEAASGGDVDGDGVPDLIVSGRPDTAVDRRGTSYLLLGPLSGTATESDARARIIGAELFSASGSALGFARAGGSTDMLVVGARNYDHDAVESRPDAGGVYLLEGLGL
jgi:hypothetical protein